MIDLTKPVQLRNGRPARIVSKKGGGMFPLLTVYVHESGTEYPIRHTLTGAATGVPGEHPLDLVNVLPLTYRRVGYLDLGHLHDTYKGAKGSTTYDWPVLKVDLELEALAPGGVRQVVSAEEVFADVA